MAKAVEVVDPQLLHPMIERVFLVDRRQPVHLVIEFERYAHIVRGQQRPALIGAFDPGGWAALGFEIGRSAVQIIFVKRLESHNLDRAGLVGFLQDDAVMPTFFHRAQVNVAVTFIGNLQSDQLGLKRLTGGKVFDVQTYMAEADGVDPLDQAGFEVFADRILDQQA